MKYIMQKYGDRGGNVGSIREYAHTIPANPMSDRGQMVLEIYEKTDADGAADEGGVKRPTPL